MKKFLKIFFGIFFVTAIFGGFYLFAKRDALLHAALNSPDALNYVEKTAADLIGTKVTVESFLLQELNIFSMEDSALIVNNIKVFDKDSELIAQVDQAKIIFKLIDLDYLKGGAGIVDKIDITGAQAFIKKRTDDSWNLQDIKIKDTGESTFDAEINLTGGTISADFDGKNISVNDIQATADCADLNAVETKLSAETLGSHISATGTLGADKQIINAIIDTADILKILRLKIPCRKISRFTAARRQIQQ